MKLETGAVIPSGNYKLKRQIIGLDEFYDFISRDKTIYAKNRVYSTAFFFSWHIKTVKNWIDNGWFWIIDSID